MSNKIAELEKTAKAPSAVKIKVSLPDVKLKVQRTLTFKELDILSGSQGMECNFPTLDKKLLEASYYDNKLKALLPCFGFFNVKEEPDIKIVIQCINNKKPFINSKESLNLFQPGFKLDGAFSFWRVFYNSWAGWMNAILTWGLTVMLSCPFLLQQMLHQNDYNYQNGWVIPVIIIGLVGFIIGCVFINSDYCSERIFSTFLANMIPDDVVDIIYKHKNTFNYGIFIIADVENKWEARDKNWTVLPQVDLDPLVVGVDYNAVTEKYTYYLVHRFDLTPKEAFISGS